MLITLRHVFGAGLMGLLAATAFFQLTRVPQVVYSPTTVQYREGYPQIEVWDVVEVYSPDGEKIPRSEWKTVLKGRFDPIPSEG